MVSKKERSEAGSYCVLVIEHLLKLAYSPAQRARKEWRHTVRLYRRELARFGPGIRPHLEERLPRLYRRARRSAARSMREYRESEAADMLAEECPWTLEQILDPGFEPERRWRLRRDPGP